MHDPALEHIVRARQTLSSNIYELKVIQDPGESRALGKPEKSRGAKWPLDPPPVLELVVRDNDPHRTFLHSPFYICNVTLETIHNISNGQQPKGLAGTTSSSLHKVKLTDNREERGYFVFGDLNIMNAGTHRLKFALFEMRHTPDGSRVVQLLTTAESKQFKVHPAKMHLAPKESTPLSKQLCEAGIKLRIRKETSNKRRGPQFEWAADRAQILPPNAFPPRGLIAPPRNMAGPRFSNGTPGVDIRDRLTLSTGNSLGIRSHLDNSMLPNRSDSTTRTFDPWTTSQPGYASHPAYTTPMPSYHQVNPTHSMPPTTNSSYELHTGYAPYSDAAYQTPRHSMPPTNYNTSSNIHPESEHSHLGGNDHSYYPGSNAYSQMHTGGAMDDFDHPDTGHVPDFPASFMNSTTMTSTGSDQHFTFAALEEGSKAHQIGQYVDSGDPFR